MRSEEDGVLEIPNVEDDVRQWGGRNGSEEDEGGVDREEREFLGSDQATRAGSSECQGLKGKGC